MPWVVVPFLHVISSSTVSLKFLPSHIRMLSSFCYFGPWPHPIYPRILYIKIASRLLWTYDIVNFSFSDFYFTTSLYLSLSETWHLGFGCSLRKVLELGSGQAEGRSIVHFPQRCSDDAEGERNRLSGSGRTQLRGLFSGRMCIQDVPRLPALWCILYMQCYP